MILKGVYMIKIIELDEIRITKEELEKASEDKN